MAEVLLLNSVWERGWEMLPDFFVVCPSILWLQGLSGGWVLGSVSLPEVTVEACQVQRGKGTISLLCLGGWGVAQAGDVAASEEGGRGRCHLRGWQRCDLPSDRGSVAARWAQLRDCVCRAWVFLVSFFSNNGV